MRSFDTKKRKKCVGVVLLIKVVPILRITHFSLALSLSISGCDTSRSTEKRQALQFQ